MKMIIIGMKKLLIMQPKMDILIALVRPKGSELYSIKQMSLIKKLIFAIDI